MQKLNIIDISIIIPCYNQGSYLDDAIESICSNKTSYSLEVIVVNDGSTEPYTLQKLTLLGHHIKVIHQENQGLAAARNKGISLAKGKYIIPLDADNKVHENYLKKAIEILEKNQDLDIVYGNPILFGDDVGIRKIGKLDINKLLKENYIDACAVYRKELWERLGGYDGQMPGMGNEDWEFWLNAFFKDAKFHYLNKPCFYYRVSKLSMSATTTRPKFINNRRYIYEKHLEKIIEIVDKAFYTLEYLRTDRLKGAIKIITNKL